MEAFLPLLLICFILFITLRGKKAAIAKKAVKKRKPEDREKMIEFAKRFIGKKCLIESFDSSHQFTGTIKEVSDGAILIENGNCLEAVNLDFVIRIREYPKNKKGKEKALILG